MKCPICQVPIDGTYLCENHSVQLFEILKKGEGRIPSPDFKCHCSICGDFEGKTIIDFQGSGYFCKECIEESYGRFGKVI